MKKICFLFDGSKCNGCRACAIACKSGKGLPQGVWLRTVKESPRECEWLSVSCNHCAEPACAAVCPVKAYTKEPDRLVLQDHSKCIGCQACVSACPFGAPAYSTTEKKVYKCDGCAQRLAAGLAPACTSACTTGALQLGSLEEFKSKYPQAEVKGWEWAKQVFNYPEKTAATKPSLIIIALS